MPDDADLVAFYVPAGGGHRAVAMGAAAELNADTDMSVEAADFLRTVTRFVIWSRLVGIFYQFLCRPSQRWLFLALWTITAQHPIFVRKLASRALCRGTRTWIEKRQPIAVLATFPLIAGILEDAGCSVPILTILTDGDPIHPTWWQARNHTVVSASSSGFRRAQAANSRDVRFARLPETLQAAQSTPDMTEIPPWEGKTVLVWSGLSGRGLRIDRLVTRLAAGDPTLRLIVVAGSNSVLVRRLRREWAGQQHKVFSVVQNPVRLLQEADLVVGKAGWISLVEASRVGVRTVILDPLPIQEESNASYAEASGAANVARSLDHAVDLVRLLLQVESLGVTEIADLGPPLSTIMEEVRRAAFKEFAA